MVLIMSAPSEAISIMDKKFSLVVLPCMISGASSSLSVYQQTHSNWKPL
jgi:hypothetical protein